MRAANRTGWCRWPVRLLEGLLILAMGLLVLDVLWGVLSRALGEFRAWIETVGGVTLGFLPAGQSSWTEELARFLLIWTALLGSALAFERRAHLGVDYFVGRFHPSVRRWLGVMGHLLVLLFAFLILVQGGLTLVHNTLVSGQVTPALGLKKWMVYAVVPMAGGFVMLFTARNLVTDWREASG